MVTGGKVLSYLLDTLGVKLLGYVGREKPRHLVTD